MTPATDADPLQQISPLPLSAMRLVGEAQSHWAPLRRKYNLFLAQDHSLSASESSPKSTHQPENVSSEQSSSTVMGQFAYIDERFLSWDFSLLGADNRLLGSVNRSFRGFGREIFTDTGAYVLRMDAAGLEEEAANRHIVSQTHREDRAYAETVGGRGDQTGMTLDQRAVMLATAVTVDFDYFSRQSRGGGMMLPWMMMGGGGEAAGGAAGGAAGAGGAAEAGGVGAVVGEAGVGRAVGGAAGAAGAGEGAIAGAGTMAGYEAMQRGMGRDQAPADDASPQAGQASDQPFDSQSPESGFPEENGGDDWGTGNDPWQGGGGGGGGDGGGEGGGGLFQWLWDAFFGD